jgi:group I intron endonuclease
MEEVNEKLWRVYMHKNKTNGKVYIGITSRDVKDRWGLDGSRYGEQQMAFKCAIDKYGWDGFEHIIVAENLTQQEASDMEIFLIDAYKSNCRRYYNPSYGYNMTDGGEGTSGRSCAEETKKKIGEKAKERLSNPENHPWFGKHHTKESKEKMSKVRKGRPAHNKGIKASEESRKKMSESKKGRNTGEKNPNYGCGKPVIQLDKKGNIIAEYPTASEASRVVGIELDNITSCCNGKTKTAFGYQWIYKKDYDPNKTYVFINSHIKPIVQLDLDDNLIKEYISISEAEKSTHIDNRAISAVCKKKRKTTGGFKWMYKEEYDNLTQQNDLNEIEPIENLEE